MLGLSSLFPPCYDPSARRGIPVGDAPAAHAHCSRIDLATLLRAASVWIAALAGNAWGNGFVGTRECDGDRCPAGGDQALALQHGGRPRRRLALWRPAYRGKADRLR